MRLGRVLACVAILLGLALPLAARAQTFDPVQQFTVLPVYENSPDVAFSGNVGLAVWRIVTDRGYFGRFGWALSTDHGRTWPLRGEVPPPPPNSALLSGPLRVCADSTGAFFVIAHVLQLQPLAFGLAAYRPTYAGGSLTWNRLGYLTDIAPAFEALDHPVLLCAPSTNSLHVFYTRSETRIEYTRSMDGGTTWSYPIVLSVGPANGTAAAVGPDGELYVVWEDYAARSVIGRRSFDDGLTFSPAFVVAPMRDDLGFAPPGWSWNDGRPLDPYEANSSASPAAISLAVDRSSGPRRGTLYCTWSEYGAGTLRPISRYVYETEPNDRPEYATPILPGDAVTGEIRSADLSPPCDCDFFIFPGLRGTTIQITGSLSSSGPVDVRVIGLVCKDAQDSLLELGAQAMHTSKPSAPFVFTVPEDGTYYLDLGCCSQYSSYYTFYLNIVDIDPASASRDHRDVVLVSSSNGGATWSPKIRVNDEPPWYDDAIPGVGVTGDGRVHVVWYDRRDAVGCPSIVSTYRSWSEDGGQSFHPSERLHLSTFDLRRGEEPWKVGDYILMRQDGVDLWTFWAEATGYHDTDIFYTRIEPDGVTGIVADGLQAVPVMGGIQLSWWAERGGAIERFVLHRAVEGSAEAPEILVELSADGAGGEMMYDDTRAEEGVRYTYRVEVVLREGGRVWLGPVVAERAPSAAAASLTLSPNPFTSAATALLSGPDGTMASLRVVDLAGRLVRELGPVRIGGGRAGLIWDGRNHSGEPARPGIYVIRAHVGSREFVRRAVKVR